jgi:hypothetical protein
MSTEITKVDQVSTEAADKRTPTNLKRKAIDREEEENEDKTLTTVSSKKQKSD